MAQEGDFNSGNFILGNIKVNDGKFKGTGTLIKVNGDKYVGKFKDGKFV